MAEKVVFKYDITDINIVGEITISLPIDAKIVHAGMQHAHLCIWAEITKSASTVRRTFFIVGTGHSFLDDQVQHIATFFIDGGAFVFHLYERG